MDTKIGRETKDGKQTFLSQPFWAAGHVMREVYDLEMDAGEDDFDSRERHGCMVFTGEDFGWLPDAALLGEMVAPYDFGRVGRSLLLEQALAEAMGR